MLEKYAFIYVLSEEREKYEKVEKLRDCFLLHHTNFGENIIRILEQVRWLLSLTEVIFCI